MNINKAIILFLGLTSLGVAFKFNIIQKYGSDVAYMDPWGAEAEITILPYLEERLDYISTFWAAHCEHHVGLTRFWSLLITLINGQWDNKVICSINAVFSSSIIGLFLIVYNMHLKSTNCILFVISCIIINTNPISWENTLGCFQIQFSFSLVSCILYIFLGTQSDKLYKQIICFLVGLISLNSMASCVFAPLAVILTQIIIMIKDKEYKKRLKLSAIHIPMLLIGLSVVNYVPGHEPLKAESFYSFIFAFINICSTPIFPIIKISYINLLCAIFVNFPFILFVYYFFREKISNSLPVTFTLAFGIFLYVSFLATSFSRNLNFDSSRYFDNFYLIILLNSMAMILILNHKIRFKLQSSICMIWYIIIISFHAITFYKSVPKVLIEKWGLHQKNLYLLSNGIISVDQFNEIQLSELPYINHHTLSNLITNSRMADYLPSSIRKEQPVRILNDSEENNSVTFKNIKQSGFFRNFSIIDKNSIHIVGKIETDFRNSDSFYRINYTGSSSLNGSIIKLFSNGKVIQSLPSKEFHPYQWRQAHFVFPEGNSKIEIGLTKQISDDSWVAFSNPVEVTGLSWLLRQIRKNSLFIFFYYNYIVYCLFDAEAKCAQ